MIDEPNILHWRTLFPWPKMQQVEQDLLISRAVVAIYSDPFLAPRLAWRGGTALYKLHLRPQARYSEDIDLVLVNPEPMGPILDRLREVLSFVPDMQAKGKRYSHIFRPGINFDVDSAWANVRSRIVDRLMAPEDRRECK